MSAVVASYGFGLLNPTVERANEPPPSAKPASLHVASIGNDVLLAFPAVAWAPSTYLTIVTVTSGHSSSYVADTPSTSNAFEESPKGAGSVVSVRRMNLMHELSGRANVESCGFGPAPRLLSATPTAVQLMPSALTSTLAVSRAKAPL